MHNLTGNRGSVNVTSNINKPIKGKLHSTNFVLTKITKYLINHVYNYKKRRNFCFDFVVSSFSSNHFIFN